MQGHQEGRYSWTNTPRPVSTHTDVMVQLTAARRCSASLTVIHQSHGDRLRLSTWLSDPVDIFCSHTKLILALWKEVLEGNTILSGQKHTGLYRSKRQHEPFLSFKWNKG